MTITAKDPVYKVQYLGNVHTSFMKGDGCVDKAMSVLWRCFLRNMGIGAEMEITVCAFGLKAKTKDAGTVEYRTHRIPYCIAHPQYPKVFAWVYKHEGKKMRMDLRCHAVVCKNQTVAKAIALKLHENMQQALKDFLREKNQKQRARLLLQRTNSAKSFDSEDEATTPKAKSYLPLRRKLLSTAGNFKPSVERLPGAPRLRSIDEGNEEPEDRNRNIIDVNEIGEGEMVVDLKPIGDSPTHTLASEDTNGWTNGNHLEVGNDVEELKQDSDVRRCCLYGDTENGESKSYL